MIPPTPAPACDIAPVDDLSLLGTADHVARSAIVDLPRRLHDAADARTGENAVLAVGWIAVPSAARAEDVFEFATLQMFDARWQTIENRMADVREIGYGRPWLRPSSRTDSGNYSVCYDVFHRFDVGKPRDETFYGTETCVSPGNASYDFKKLTLVHTPVMRPTIPASTWTWDMASARRPTTRPCSMREGITSPSGHSVIATPPLAVTAARRCLPTPRE